MQNNNNSWEKKLFELSKFDHLEILYAETLECLTRYGENEITQNVSKENTVIQLIAHKSKKRAKIVLGNEIPAEEAILRLNKIIDLVPATPEEDYIEPYNPRNEPGVFRHNSEIKFVKNKPEINPSEIAMPAIEACKIGIEKQIPIGGISSLNYNYFKYVNSNGVSKEQDSQSASFTATAEKDQGTGNAEGFAKTISEIDYKKVIKTAIDKCDSSQKLDEIPPGKYTVLLEPLCVSEMLTYLIYVMTDPSAYYHKTNPFAGKLNEKIFSDKLTLIADRSVMNEKQNSYDFDFEGVDTKPYYVLNKGNFENISLSRLYAKKFNKVTNGSCVDSLAGGALPLGIKQVPGNKSYEELIQESNNVVLLTNLHYVNLLEVNSMTITGMTRNGTFLIENGKVTKALKNMRFTISLFDILNNIESLSNEKYKSVQWGMVAFETSSMKINNFNFSSSTSF